MSKLVIETVQAAISARIHGLSENQARAELRRLGAEPNPRLAQYPHTQLSRVLTERAQAHRDEEEHLNWDAATMCWLERELELADELPGKRLELDGAAWAPLPGDGLEWFATETAQIAAWKLWHKLAPVLAGRGEKLEISVRQGVAVFESTGAPQYEGFRAAVCPETGAISHVGEQSSPSLPAPSYDCDWWRSGSLADAKAGRISFDASAIQNMAAAAAMYRALLAGGGRYAGVESWAHDAALYERTVREALSALESASLHTAA